jgi:hypothetical protein
MPREIPKNLVPGQQRVRPLGKVSTHVFHDSGQRDYKDRRCCEWCGNLDTHRIHDVTVISEAEAIDRRVIGERDE